MSVSSSFRSKNSGTASPSLYAQQSPCLYPVHSGPSLGNHTQLQPGRPLSTVRVSCRGPRGSTPQPSFPHPQQATLSGDPCCQPVRGLCSSVLAWESSLPPWRTAHFCSTQSLLTLCVCPSLENHTRPYSAPSSGQYFIPGTSESFLCTDRPRRLRSVPHISTLLPLWLCAFFVWDLILFPHPLHS